MELAIPALKDVLQEMHGNLEVPEIRVWCHPPLVGKSGDDICWTFESFKDAFAYIEHHKEAERQPLLAFKGYEINLFAELKELAPSTA